MLGNPQTKKRERLQIIDLEDDFCSDVHRAFDEKPSVTSSSTHSPAHFKYRKVKEDPDRSDFFDYPTFEKKSITMSQSSSEKGVPKHELKSETRNIPSSMARASHKTSGKASLVGYIVTDMKQFYENFMAPIFSGDSFLLFQQKTIRNFLKSEPTYDTIILARGIHNTLVEFNRTVIFSDRDTSPFDKNCCDLFRLDPLKLLDSTLDDLLGLLYFMNQVLKEKDPVRRRESYVDLWFDPHHGNRCAKFTMVPEHLHRTQAANYDATMLGHSYVINQLKEKSKYLQTFRHHPRLPTSEKDVYFTSLNGHHFAKFGNAEFVMKHSLIFDFKKHCTPFDE